MSVNMKISYSEGAALYVRIGKVGLSRACSNLMEGKKRSPNLVTPWFPVEENLGFP